MQVEFLFAIALILRASGAALRTGRMWSPFRFIGWVLCATAAWMAADSVGAWFPIWPVLVLGAAGFLADSRVNRHIIWTGTDISVILLSGILSIPRVDLGVLAEIFLVVVAFGLISDVLLLRVGKSVNITLSIIPAIGMIGMAIGMPDMVGQVSWLSEKLISKEILFHVGLTPARAINEKQITLETGAVAWLYLPNRAGVIPGALVFHGADKDASHQAAAVVLRHALLDAGFAVLAIDHPGYGKSPSPMVDADISEWDPLPTARAGLEKLKAQANVGGIYAIGHSMGSTDALRLLAVDPSLSGGLLFGATAGKGGEEDNNTEEHFYKLFHIERQLHEWMPREKVREIRHRYYDDGVMLKFLKRNHPPVYFVRFGLEFPNIYETRDAMYESIPGEKTIWDLNNSTHFFSSYELKGFVVGDTRVTRDLSIKLRSLVAK